MKNLKISYKDIKENFKNSDYLIDFLNDYYFYKIDGNINDKVFSNIELEELLNEGYMSDNISEFSDRIPSIYNSDLLDWLKNNYSLYDDAINELGDQGDLMRNIMQARYLDTQNILMEELSELKDFLIDFEIDFNI